MANILAVDDDREIGSLLQTALERDGHRVRVCRAGAQVTGELCRWADCILLDVMMPGEDGVALCRRIRDLTGAPILFLTAKDGEADILQGLAAGGDDYLRKPFRVAELRARVNAHLRRQQRGVQPTDRLLRGEFALDMAAKVLYAGQTPLHLTRAEYALCEYLALHPGRTFSKEQLYEAVFGYDGSADERAVTEHIKNIRAKMRAALPGADPIETVWGIGYRWKGATP